MISFLNHIQKSIFGRLLFIFSLTAIAIIFIISFSFKMTFKDQLGPQQQRNTLVKSHVRYLIDDIGTPPNIEKIKHLSKTLNLKIMFNGPNGLWQSHTKMLPLEKLRKLHTINNKLSIARYRNKHFIIYQDQDYTYYITGLRPFRPEHSNFWLLFAFSISLLLTYLSYRSVKWLFRPLDQIKTGAKKISNGDLSYRIDNKRQDEIGEITQSVNNMAEELEKMIEAKRQLLLGISHELRTPLTRAKVGIEFIDNQKIKISISDDLNELDAMINELLEAEKLNQKHVTLQINDVNLSALVSGVVKDMNNKDENESIQLELPIVPVHARVDTLRIKLLLRNLLGNALKYGNNKPVAVSLHQHGSQIKLLVRDNGEGIEAEHIPHLTEPFYRADSARQRQTGGYGLGLYLCRLILEAHKGTLNIDSEKTRGTTITATLQGSSTD